MKKEKHQVVADANCHDFHYTPSENDELYKKDWRYYQAVSENQQGFNYTQDELNQLKSIVEEDPNCRKGFINAATELFLLSKKTKGDADKLRKRFELSYGGRHTKEEIDDMFDRASRGAMLYPKYSRYF